MADKDLTFPAKTIATFLGLSIARVGQLAKEGTISKQANGRYLPSAITEYVEWLRSKAFGKGAGGTGIQNDANVERARLLKEQADKEEMNNQLRRGELAPVSDMQAAMSQVYAKQVAIFESVPARIKRECPELSARGLDVVRKELAKARNLAAEQLPDE